MNLKKGQFVAPVDMVQAARKAVEAGNPILVTERGASFGYHNLVVDMRGLSQMRDAGLAVCFDATHSVQLPSATGRPPAGNCSSSRCSPGRRWPRAWTRFFMEVHENPELAPCDGPSSLTPAMADALLGQLVAIRRALGQA